MKLLYLQQTKNIEKTAVNKASDARKKVAATPKKAAITTSAKPLNTNTMKSSLVKITFMLRFKTRYGQSLFITGNHPVLGDNDYGKALPLSFLNDEFWALSIEMDPQIIPAEGITYNYGLKNEDGAINIDWGKDKIINASSLLTEEVLIIDCWNHAGYAENTFYTEPFKNVLLKQNYTPVKQVAAKKVSHVFKVKSPLLQKGQTLCMIGNTKELGNWEEAKAIVLNRAENEDYFTVQLDISKTQFPIVYKYGVYDLNEQKMILYETGNNRVLYDAVNKNKTTIVNDGFAVLPINGWKGAGVAIPVFSLRSENSCGVGEFTDLHLLVDWAKKVGLKLIQILPVNDTTATNTWTDSYPYAAISAFALHPMFLNLEKATDTKNKHLLEPIGAQQQTLNKLDTVNYEAVNTLKWGYIKQIYPLQKKQLFESDDYAQYFQINKHWLVPYAAFCYLRDKNGTADFNRWTSLRKYNDAAVEALMHPDAESHDEIAIHFFVQYLLHLQLKDATQYAHDNGIIVKGDIPIGIYRYGADAWQHPDLYHMHFQAGAPPDDFAVTGQNWGFPTYNWARMKEDGFTWWKLRFEQMSYYFDAFRIDHILGFFRIWSIPLHAVEGIMGHFEPSIPIHINEFNERNIWFNYNRYCRPYVTEQLINDLFGDQANHVKSSFLVYDGFDNYHFKADFDTQQKVEQYFSRLENNEHNQWLKKELFGLLANVIMFEADGSAGQQFHFRIAMDSTTSFKQLDAGTQYQLKELYLNYFFSRQDDFWKQEALQKLPALKRSTNMLICGEDLGMVPACVPDVMQQLGILSLEIQRMPKDPKTEFFHPADAPYLSVVTPSTHDMSTVRGWWEEDRGITQRFYNNIMGQWGNEPYFCDAWVNKAIVLQHLFSPAMWSVFQLQDILGINAKIRRANPHDERINVPANPKHYWRYRMHLTLENLLQQTDFNDDLLQNINASGRI